MSRLPDLLKQNHLLFLDLWPFETGHDGYLLLGASCWGHGVL